MKKPLLDKIKEDFNDANLKDNDNQACVKLAQREYQMSINAIKKYKEEKDKLNSMGKGENIIVTGDFMRKAVEEGQYRQFINEDENNNTNNQNETQKKQEVDEPTR